MGGDSSPSIVFDAVILALEKLDPSLKLLVIGTKPVIHDLGLKARSLLQTKDFVRVKFFQADDFIEMKDDPLIALKQKKKSSIVLGMKLLKKKKIDAFISAGNTGALLASATLLIQKLPSITRPALLAVLPTKKGSVAILDVGGNISSKPKHLLAYAYMGSAYQKCTTGLESPKVGLLNIGQESKKGTSLVREAYHLISQECQKLQTSDSPPYMQFSGNVEGRQVFEGVVDVLVTDGFTGNVLLKTSEGIADVIFDYLKDSMEGNSSPKIEKTIHSIRSMFHYADYQGALLCGIDGLVIKCHGHSNTKALFNGIKGAVNMIENNLLSQIKSHLILS